MRWAESDVIKSPEQVSRPPVGTAICSFSVHKGFSGLFPTEEQHWRQKAGNTQQKEFQRPATEDSIDTRHVEQDNEQDSFASHTTEHVFIDTRVNQWALD
jgi:hypothetical protein